MQVQVLSRSTLFGCKNCKYYSYVKATKTYEGKNVFKPGKSPMLTFDAKPLSEESLGMQVNVIAGGPCSGKTTLLKVLAEKLYFY